MLSSWDITHKASYNRAPLINTDAPSNQNAHNWDNYRLSNARIVPLINGATRFHARCHRNYANSANDYLFGNIDLMQNNYGGYATESNGTNPHNLSCKVRGYSCGAYNFLWWNIDGGSNWHNGFDVSGTLPNPTSSEDSFTWHDGGLHPDHLCHSSAGEVVWMVR